MYNLLFNTGSGHFVKKLEERESPNIFLLLRCQIEIGTERKRERERERGRDCVCVSVKAEFPTTNQARKS